MNKFDNEESEGIQELRELRDRLRALEEEGLTDTAEYEELSSDYQALAIDVLDLFSETSYCTLYVYQHDYDREVPHGDYDSFNVACDIGDEMIESGEILSYYVIVHEDE